MSTPDVREEELTSEDEVLIMASDGLWDVISNQEAINIIKDTPVRQSPPLSAPLRNKMLCQTTLLLMPGWSNTVLMTVNKADVSANFLGAAERQGVGCLLTTSVLRFELSCWLAGP